MLTFSNLILHAIQATITTQMQKGELLSQIPPSVRLNFILPGYNTSNQDSYSH